MRAAPTALETRFPGGELIRPSRALTGSVGPEILWNEVPLLTKREYREQPVPALA